jgi:hypothetical protein
MTRECNLGLDKWEIADNIDLYYVLQDFEEYYEMKFQRKPVLVRKSFNEVDPKKCKTIFLLIIIIERVNLPKIGSANPAKNENSV